MINEIKSAWGWLGVEPIEVVATNAFGNIIFKDATSRFWRLCPEELSCSVVAEDQQELDRLLGDADFLLDWEMEKLVSDACQLLGSPAEGRCYCLKIPGVLGGSYDSDNLSTIPISELISFSGYLAHQIDDLPDGTQIQIEFTD